MRLSASAQIRSLIASIVCITAHAQQLGGPIFIGVPAQNFRPVASAAAGDNWCWAAAIQSVLAAHGVSVSQSYLATVAFGSPLQIGATDQQITARLNAIAVNSNGAVLHVSSLDAVGPPPPAALIEQLSHRSPIIMKIQLGPTEFHAVVVFAATLTQTPSGPVITDLGVFDTNPSAWSSNAGVAHLSGAALTGFISQINHHWLIFVS